MEVIKLPSHIVNSSKDIELSFVVVHRMAVPDRRYLTLLLQPGKFIIGEIEAPKVIQPTALSLAPEDIYIAVIARHRSAYPGTWSI